MAGEWRFNPSVHCAKGDRLVRARVLLVCDNALEAISHSIADRGLGQTVN